MKFEVGDKVLVLLSNEEAEVVEIINDKMVTVEVRGVKFPAYIDQLDFPYFKRFTEKKILPPKKEKTYIDQIPVEKKKRPGETYGSGNYSASDSEDKGWISGGDKKRQFSEEGQLSGDKKGQSGGDNKGGLAEDNKGNSGGKKVLSAGGSKNAKYEPIAGPCSLRFLPVSDTDEFGDEVVESLKIYLVNQSNAGMNFNYQLIYGGKADFSLNNSIAPGKDFYLHDIAFATLNDAPVFTFEFSLEKPNPTKAPFYERSLKLKAKQVFQRIEEMRKKGDASFAFPLFENYPDKFIEEEKPEYAPTGKFASKENKLYDAKNGRQHLEPAKYEVDLHIEKLESNWQGLSNFEILTIQLRQFEKWLDLAIAHHQHNLIVIHGVGTGKLKDEIHQILNSRREVKSFINQYDPRYGYGATEIFL